MSSDEDRRQLPRLSTNIEVDYASENTFLFAYITDISSMGIFVKTDDPADVGTEIQLKFAPPNDVQDRMRGPAEALELRGRVVWKNMGEGGGNKGMGVKFIDLTPKQRSVLLDLVRAIAYLDDNDGN